MSDVKVQVTEDLNAIKYFGVNNQALLLSQLVFGLPYFTDPTIRQMPYLRKEENLPKYTATDGWRPLDENVNTTKGTQGVFSKRTIAPKTGMKILKVRPQQFKQTFMADYVGPNAKNIPVPFAEYFWKAQNAQTATEITRNSFWGLDPATITEWLAGSAYAVGDIKTFTKDAEVGEQYWECTVITSAGESPSTHPAKWKNVDNRCVAKGLGTILKAEYAGLPASQKIATGAHTDTNASAHAKQLWRSLPDELKSGPGKWVIYCSIATGEKYLDDVQTKHYNGVVTEEASMLVVRGSSKRCFIKPVEWMGSAPGMILTQEKNIVAGTDLSSDFATIGKMVDDLHGFHTIQKAVLAFQFADLEIVYLDDQGWT